MSMKAVAALDVPSQQFAGDAIRISRSKVWIIAKVSDRAPHEYFVTVTYWSREPGAESQGDVAASTDSGRHPWTGRADD